MSLVRSYFNIVFDGSGNVWCAPTSVTLTHTIFCQGVVTTWTIVKCSTLTIHINCVTKQWQQNTKQSQEQRTG